MEHKILFTLLNNNRINFFDFDLASTPSIREYYCERELLTTIQSLLPHAIQYDIR